MNYQDIETAIGRAGLTIHDMHELPATAQQTAPLPSKLFAGSPQLKAFLETRYPSGQTRKHQSIALDHVLNGRDVVVATGTASGKSRIFQYAALEAALRLEPRATLVLYPVKALASDQQKRWEELLKEAGLPETTLARIDGTVAIAERAPKLAEARIVLMTPDVCQAWLMRNLKLPEVRKFLISLRLVVLDEAHVYDGVFGSNTAFLLRRLVAAQYILSRGKRRLQFIAATATNEDPAAHLEALTGRTFEVVDKRHDGSPTQTRRVYLVSAPDFQEQAEPRLAEAIKELGNVAGGQRIIAFHDSRQGTERVTKELGDPQIQPYRSGYEDEDRKLIESGLRDGKLRGIVSTSAMEMGIDIPKLDIGLNLYLPRTRKQFQQRFGRVGRSAPGVFILLVPPEVVQQMGKGLAHYCQQPVEPTYLYLENRFMQFAHGRCLLAEFPVAAPQLWSEINAIPRLSWPPGFDQQLINAGLRGLAVPPDFQHMARLAGTNPHRGFPLRLLGEENMEIFPPNARGDPDTRNRIENIALGQALREAYIGATYLHLNSPYQITAWWGKTDPYCVLAKKREKLPITSPLLERRIIFDRDMVINGRLLAAAGGFVTESRIVVTERVVGYDQFLSTGKTIRTFYGPQDRKKRVLRTTGVVIALPDNFIDPAAAAAEELVALGNALKDRFIQRHGVEPEDIELSVGECAMVAENGPKQLGNCVVIYDAAYGGMRITEKLFDDFLRLLAATPVGQGASSLLDAGGQPLELEQSFIDWVTTLQPKPITNLPEPARPDHKRICLAVGSQVLRSDGNRLLEITIKGLAKSPIQGDDKPYYRYELASGKGSGTALVPADQILATGHDWSVEKI